MLALLPVLGAALNAVSHQRSVKSLEPAEGVAGTIPLEPPVELLSVEDSGFSCAVERVLMTKCRRCHTVPPRHGAPLPLLTWQQTRRMRHEKPVYELIGRAVKSGTMPFRIAANPPVELLTAAERKVLLDWVARGAPRGACRER